MIPIALTIAGSDSGGGAGIQADLKTFSALGIYGASVVTALTAQNTQGVSAIHDLPADFVTSQIDAVYSDFKIAATKIGMLSVPATIEAVAAGLERHQAKNVVLDPVMVAASGDPLLKPQAVETLKRQLIPRALLVTPNLAEAAALAGAEIARDEKEMRVQGEIIFALGAGAVLIKGGHGVGPHAIDLLIDRDGVRRFVARRIETRNTHGTGCTLSSAIAAELARNLPLAEAVALAKNYVTEAIAAADVLHVGKGRGPVHHFHAHWPKISGEKP
jgi:hydroxymethylpyrimidine/phosphomethylpyrimidine kinase